MFESDHLITLTCHSLNKSQIIKSVRSASPRAPEGTPEPSSVRERTWHPHGHLDGGWSPPAQHPTVVLRLYSRGWFFPHGQTQSSSFCVAAPWPWASCAESVA